MGTRSQAVTNDTPFFSLLFVHIELISTHPLVSLVPASSFLSNALVLSSLLPLLSKLAGTTTFGNWPRGGCRTFPVSCFLSSSLFSLFSLFHSSIFLPIVPLTSRRDGATCIRYLIRFRRNSDRLDPLRPPRNVPMVYHSIHRTASIHLGSTTWNSNERYLEEVSEGS